MQSAVLTATTLPGWFSSSASPSPSSPVRPSAATHEEEWICFRVASCAKAAGISDRRVPKPCTSQGKASSSVTR